MKEFKIKRDELELIIQKYWFNFKFKNGFLKFEISDAMWIKANYYGDYILMSTEGKIRISDYCGELQIRLASSQILLKITEKEIKNLFQFLKENSMR